jgi:hypothetical protein
MPLVAPPVVTILAIPMDAGLFPDTRSVGLTEVTRRYVYFQCRADGLGITLAALNT